jgi:hypothetical protein
LENYVSQASATSPNRRRGPRIIEIILTNRELELAANIAFIRQHGKENYSSTNNYRKSAETSINIHTDGAEGEIAAAKYFGVSVDNEEIIDGDSGTDLIIAGWRIDIQTTIYKPAYLKYDGSHTFRADIAVLVRKASSNRFEFIGYIERSSFNLKKKPRNFGHGMRDTVGWIDLEPIEGLKNFCEQQPKVIEI